MANLVMSTDLDLPNKRVGKVRDIYDVELPDGKIRGRWDIHTVDPPNGLTFTFASDGLDATSVAVELAETSPSSTTLDIRLTFTSEEIMARARDIGFVEGVARSVGTAHDVAHDRHDDTGLGR